MEPKFDLDGFIKEQLQGADWNSTVKAWKDMAAYLADKDPTLSTICRRISHEISAYVDRLKAHKLNNQMIREEKSQEEIDQLIQQTLKKTGK